VSTPLRRAEGVAARHAASTVASVTPALNEYLLESALVLVLVIGLGWFASYAARRAGVARTAGSLELVARLPLEARRSVYVVRVLDQVLILGGSESGISKLGELPESALAELRRAPAPTWAALLAARWGRGAP
jgi:flagellar biogenesis protein FliO